MINDLKDLQALLKLCRKQGVTEIELGDVAVGLPHIKLKFGDMPVQRKDAPDESDVDTDNMPTMDELIYLSVSGNGAA